MKTKPLTLSRRTTLIAGVGLALGATTLTSNAQLPAASRTPEDETRWARMGVALTGKTVLITGSTDGLGKEVARQLGALGASVIVHGRNQERGEEVARLIRSAGGDAMFYRADLGSLAGVEELAEQILERHDRLDILVNNAAAVSGAERQTSADGYELAFAVNYLAHFVLTYRLLPLLEASAPARIVNVSSMGQTPIDFTDVMMERSYNPGDAYRRSKLAQIMFTIDLAAELDATHITVNSLHPARSMNTARVINGGFQPLSTVEEGAEATMQLAVSPELTGRSGLYFNGLNEAAANTQAYDEAARAQLRTLSRELTKHHAPSTSAAPTRQRTDAGD
jgi:NAD(P)-dependent dehydrogenase (short-subunit alcohol dehydrogenase family)